MQEPKQNDEVNNENANGYSNRETNTVKIIPDKILRQRKDHTIVRVKSNSFENEVIDKWSIKNNFNLRYIVVIITENPRDQQYKNVVSKCTWNQN